MVKFDEAGTLSEQLTEPSTRFSKCQKSSRLKCYLTPTVAGIISALVTNLKRLNWFGNFKRTKGIEEIPIILSIFYKMNILDPFELN